jgi:hypothetical protein
MDLEMTKLTPLGSDYKLEFASPEWFDFYQRLLTAANAIGRVTKGTACEVYRDVPHHLSASGTIAWTRRVKDQSVTLEFSECRDDEADFKMRASYAALLPLTRCVIGEDKSKFHSMVMDAVANGSLEIIRHDPSAPSDHLVHNLLAAMTR